MVPEGTTECHHMCCIICATAIMRDESPICPHCETPVVDFVQFDTWPGFIDGDVSLPPPPPPVPIGVPVHGVPGVPVPVPYGGAVVDLLSSSDEEEEEEWEEWQGLNYVD